jgi:hypothetical protein
MAAGRGGSGVMTAPAGTGVADGAGGDGRRTTVDALLASGLRHQGHGEERHAENHEQDEADEDCAATARLALGHRLSCDGSGRWPRRRRGDSLTAVVKRNGLVRRLTQSLAVREDEPPREHGRRKRGEAVGFESLEVSRRYAGGSRHLVE